MNLARRFAFNLPWTEIAVGVVFSGALSGYMAHLAGDYKGVIYVSLMLLSAMFAFLAVFMIARRLVFPRVLELTDEAILFPRGFPRTRITRILYTDIIRMAEAGDDARAGLYFATARGSFQILESYFSDIKSYSTARDFICSQASIVIPRRKKRERIWEEFPKPILNLVEPKDWPRYRTHLVVSKPLFPRLAKALWFFLRCFSIFVIPWLLFSFVQLRTIPAFFLCASVFGMLLIAFVITFFYHWLATIWPVFSKTISVRDKAFTVTNGKQTWDLSYADFAGWAVVERQFEGHILHILLLQRGSRVFEFALPDTVTRDQLAQLLHDKLIPHSPDLKPSWESNL